MWLYYENFSSTLYMLLIQELCTLEYVGVSNYLILIGRGDETNYKHECVLITLVSLCCTMKALPCSLEDVCLLRSLTRSILYHVSYVQVEVPV
jgi:hypothetical protein